MSKEKIIKQFLDLADIRINGKRSFDIQVHNDAFYKKIVKEGYMGLGDAYVDGLWDCEKIDQFFDKIINTPLENKIKPISNLDVLLYSLRSPFFNPQSKSRAYIVGEQHYDLGNDLFEAMLDKRLVYTCGYWKNASNLDEAQEAKLDLVCRKLNLQPGMKILDIGCGRGSFAKFAAEKYKVSVVGVTISKEQVTLGNELCKGLPVEIRLQDYRDVNEKFDHIVSLGMFEHVGHKNYKTYMKVVHRCLKDDGLFLLHTMGINKAVKIGYWLVKYIFPNGSLPLLQNIAESFEGLFVMEDWHNFGADYDKTLMAWFDNFDKNWHTLKNNYKERFYRMWKYYLLTFAGIFRARKVQLWQIVFSKNGVPDGYQSIR